MHLQANPAVPDPRGTWRKSEAWKGVLLGAQRTPAYLAESRMRPFIYSGSWYKSVQPHGLRVGSGLGMLSKSFGRHWSLYFPNSFLETVPSLTHEIQLSLWLYQDALPNQQSGEQGKWRKKNAQGTWGVRTVKSHTFRDALSKNKLITLTAFFPEKQ